MSEVTVVKAKVVLVGDKATRKTDLIRPNVVSTFSDQYLLTHGARVSKKTLEVPTADGTVRVDVLLHDILGDSRFLSLFGEGYFAQAKGVLAVCDASMPDTLKDMKKWIEAAHSVVGKVPTFILVRTGHPGEMPSGGREATAVAAGYDAGFAFAPSEPEAAGQAVEAAFRWLAERIVTSLPPRRTG